MGSTCVVVSEDSSSFSSRLTRKYGPPWECKSAATWKTTPHRRARSKSLRPMRSRHSLRD